MVREATSPMSTLHVAPPFVAGAVIAGRYRLIRRLGQGAMGVVWAAENLLTSGEVALKLLIRPDPDLGPRLIREAVACCQIRHKNVLQVQDVGQTDDGDPFLVMELLSGETLAELLERKRRLYPKEAAAVGRDVARALAAAHDKGIVHRDLKPANIILHDQPGEDARVVKVLDFGVSKNLSSAGGLRTLVGPVGSPMYMSPEQARGAPDIDARADVWSLGVLLFEMITGGRPFDGEAQEAIQKILFGEIPMVSRRVRNVDPELERIVAGCLCRERDERRWPASEIANLLDAFVMGSARVSPAAVAVAEPSSSTAALPASPSEASVDLGWDDEETQRLDRRTLPVPALPLSQTVRLVPEVAMQLAPSEAQAPAELSGTMSTAIPLAGAGGVESGPPPPAEAARDDHVRAMKIALAAGAAFVVGLAMVGLLLQRTARSESAIPAGTAAESAPASPAADSPPPVVDSPPPAEATSAEMESVTHLDAGAPDAASEHSTAAEKKAGTPSNEGARGIKPTKAPPGSRGGPLPRAKRPPRLCGRFKLPCEHG